MIIAWIGYAMLCGAAVAGCAVCVERLLGHHRFARRALWIAAMTASAVFPIVFSWNARPAPIDLPANDQASGAVARAQGTGSFDLDAFALVLWAAASLSAAAWLVFSQVRLRRALRRCEREHIGGDAVIVSPDFGPAVVGIARPEVVLPRWVLSLGDVDLRLVLAHEREHIRAGDPAWQLAGLAIAVALPWNLALWWQLKRLRLAIEIDCDSRVIGRHAVDPVRYGELLVRAHATAPAATSSALALVQHRSTLARRVDALLGLPGRTTVRLATTSALGFAVASLVAFVPAPPIRRAPARTVVSPAVERVVPAPVAVAASAARVTPSVNAKRRPRARQLALPTTIPPMHIIPNTATSIVESAPSAAALPVRRFGTAVITPRAVGGFAVSADSSVARAGGAGGAGGRAGTIRAAGGRGGGAGGVFARPVRPDSGGSSAAAAGTGASASSDSSRGRAVAGTVVPASGAPRPSKPPTP